MTGTECIKILSCIYNELDIILSNNIFKYNNLKLEVLENDWYILNLDNNEIILNKETLEDSIKSFKELSKNY